MNTLQEALDKDKAIGNEIGEILDKLIAFRTGKDNTPLSASDVKGFLVKIETLQKKRAHNNIEIESLSNGMIHFKRGGGVVIHTATHSSQLD
ncbi:MAG: hypothetical protein AAGU17_10785 [Anaerolineaceae bacterium]|jgi:hypothetical protein